MGGTDFQRHPKVRLLIQRKLTLDEALQDVNRLNVDNSYVGIALLGPGVLHPEALAARELVLFDRMLKAADPALQIVVGPRVHPTIIYYLHT